jgi:aminoglycoside phosphotransferase (APT) family kinase protein
MVKPRAMQSPMQPWQADVDVTVEVARGLIATYFPELGEPLLEPLGEGWDNAAFLVNGTYVFRFPRRAVSAGLIEREVRVLPAIAPYLSLAIPVPALVASGDQTYPWTFAGYAILRGTPLSACDLDDAEYERLARALGAFLRELHSIDRHPWLEGGLVRDEVKRLDHAVRRPKAVERLNELHAQGLVDNADSLIAYLDAIAPQGAREEALALVHGDFYARHILLDDTRNASGVIDWGDVHIGDVAVDVSGAFAVLPPSVRGAFFDAYGSIGERTAELARYRAIYHSALLAHYGMHVDEADLLRAGLLGLRYASP